ncbi:UNVERIFIED_CONTAM: hypothetical protein K2H54_043310 [Gekko kuhli]
MNRQDRSSPPKDFTFAGQQKVLLNSSDIIFPLDIGLRKKEYQVGCHLIFLILGNLGHILVQACSHTQPQGSHPSLLHSVGPIHMDHTTMDITTDITPDITHLLAHLECFLEGLDSIQEHHHHLFALPQDTTMGTTRSTSIMSMAAIMGIISTMARSTQAVPVVAVPTQTEDGFCNTSAN